MTFGLKNAGATYQRLVNKVFKPLIGKTMEVYVDDMITKSKISKEHVGHGPRPNSAPKELSKGEDCPALIS